MTTSFAYMRDRIRHTLNGVRSARLTIKLSDDLLAMLTKLAAQDGLTPAQYAGDLLAETLIARHHARDENIRHWELLSEREKQVAALVCLEHTNPEIGLQLHIAKDTVKSHMKNILRKFELKGRGQLRWVLKEWDFGAYQHNPPSPRLTPRANPQTPP